MDRTRERGQCIQLFSQVGGEVYGGFFCRLRKRWKIPINDRKFIQKLFTPLLELYILKSTTDDVPK